MKKEKIHIRLFASMVLLLVFTIGLIPFDVFHQHEEELPPCTTEKQHCGHNYHIHKQTEKCLICTFHFEKNYTTVGRHYQIYLVNNPFSTGFGPLSSSYAALLSLGLRGPPPTSILV